LPHIPDSALSILEFSVRHMLSSRVDSDEARIAAKILPPRS